MEAPPLAVVAPRSKHVLWCENTTREELRTIWKLLSNLQKRGIFVMKEFDACVRSAEEGRLREHGITEVVPGIVLFLDSGLGFEAALGVISHRLGRQKARLSHPFLY